MQTDRDIKAIWNQVVDQVKHKVIHPTLWRALEAAVPVLVDDGQFVVGFGPTDYHMSGLLVSSDHKNAIESALRELTGQTFTIRILEGTTLQDWQNLKAKEQQLAAMRDAAYQKRQAEAALAKSWEGLLEIVGRRYANMPLRTLPQARAKYIREIIPIISETMDVLMPDGQPVDEVTERSLARVLDKVGTVTEVPPALIAIELQRYREK